MAIRKEDALQQLTKDQQAEVQEYERRIDHAIHEGYDGTPLIMSENLPTSNRVQKLLQKKYAEAGWKLSFHHDQRDGGWIELS